MKNKFLTALICSACCLSTYAKNQDEYRFYLGAEGTYAVSLNANINVSSIPSASGAYFNSSDYNSNKLKQTFGYGLLAGYNLSDIFALELAYNNRPSFKYEKPPVINSTQHTRYFDLQNQTTILNGVIHLAPIFAVLKAFKDCSNIEPFINLGAGFARNTITNSHTVGSNNASSYYRGASYSQMIDKTVYKLAAQAGLGLNYNLNARWQAKAGYRFIYGGKFTSQDYILDNPDYIEGVGTANTGNSIAPWEGTLKANEVYLGLTYLLQ